MKNITLNQNLFIIFVCLGLGLLPNILTSQNYTVSTAEEFNNLSLNPGSVVTWRNGTYNGDENISITANGTLSNPITLKAETPGGVIFTGEMTMDIGADYVIVEDFYWNGGPAVNNHVEFRKGSQYANNSIIRNCVFNNLEPSGTDKHRWIVLYGTNNTIQNCSFLNKRSPGALILVELEYNDFNPVGHIIRDNYFYNYEARDPSTTHAGDSETIRVGTSEFQDKSASTTVQHNYFFATDGENEIITNKSADNVYKYNTFRNSHGSLVLRHGARALVEGNYFLGQNKEGSGGIRVTDSDHIIINNYMQNLNNQDDAWNNGITLVGGSATSGGTSNGYQKVDNILVAFNTIYNCDDPLYYNDRNSYDPTGTFAYNLVYSTKGQLITGDISGTGQGMKYIGNLFGGETIGLTNAGITEGDANFISNGEIFKPNNSGLAANAAGSGYVDLINLDIEEKNRPASNRDIGAHEISGGTGTANNAPITNNDVGVNVGACFIDAQGNLLTNCESNPVDNTNILTVSTIGTLSSTNHNVTLSVTSNQNWTASDNTSWLEVTPTTGSNNDIINVTVLANTSNTPRSGIITVTGGDITRQITVNQEGEAEVTPPNNSGVNLALNKTVIATGTADGANVPANIVDNDTNTRWSSNGFPKSATIDLGKIYNLESTQVICYQNRAYQFTIAVANEESGPFTQVVNRSNNSTPGTPTSPITDNFSNEGRFIKVTITGAANYTGNWVSLTQVKVFGTEIDIETPTTNLPTPWQTNDIGAVEITGNTTYSNGTFSVFGSGQDIWNNEDEFRFVYQPLNNNGEIIAQVNSIDYTHPWAKAGVMVREILNNNAVHAMAVVTPANGVSFQRRTSTGSTSEHTTISAINAPIWLRLTRNDNLITAYYGINGSDWTQIGNALSLNLQEQVQIGLCVTSHNDGVLTQAVFDNVIVNHDSNTVNPGEGSNESFTINIDEDTYIRGGNYADNSYVNASEIWLKEPNNNSFKRRGFFKFQLKNLTQQVIEAKLLLTPTIVSSNGDLLTSEVYTTNSWDSDLVWNDNPVLDTLLDSHNAGYQVEEPVGYDITNYINSLITNGDENGYLAIKSDGGDSSSTLVRFASTENDNAALHPIIQITTAAGASNFIGNATALSNEEQLIVYPVPTQEILHINYSNTIPYKNITLTNLKGQQIFSVNKPNQNVHLDMSGVPPGLYILKATMQDGSVVLKKIIK